MLSCRSRRRFGRATVRHCGDWASSANTGSLNGSIASTMAGCSTTMVVGSGSAGFSTVAGVSSLAGASRGLFGIRLRMRVVTGSTAVIGPRDSARVAVASMVLAAFSDLIFWASSWAGGRGSRPSSVVGPACCRCGNQQSLQLSVVAANVARCLQTIRQDRLYI